MTALWDAARREEPLEEPGPADGGPDADFLDDEDLGDAGLLGEKVAARVESLRRKLSPRRAGNPAPQRTLLLRAVAREIEMAHKDAGKGDLGDYTGTALTWRVANLVLPEALTETQLNLARHGVKEPMTPIGDGSYPLPSERFIVAHSLTWAEARQYRPFAEFRIADNPVLARKDFGLLWVAIWIITFERVKLPGHPLESPLPQSQLDAAAKMLALAVGTRRRRTGRSAVLLANGARAGHAAAMRAGTWNLEWAAREPVERERQAEVLAALRPDVWVLTEARADVLPEGWASTSSAPIPLGRKDGGCFAVLGAPHLEPVAVAELPTGAGAVITTHGQRWLVLGVCMPWRNDAPPLPPGAASGAVVRAGPVAVGARQPGPSPPAPIRARRTRPGSARR